MRRSELILLIHPSDMILDDPFGILLYNIRIFIGAIFGNGIDVKRIQKNLKLDGMNIDQKCFI